MTTSQQSKIKEWIKVAERRGWTVTVNGAGSHLKWMNPDGVLVAVTPGSPNGGNRSIQNVRAKLRRAGLKDII